MNATEAQIAERLPVWEALSEFFLDTELQPSDHERIAKTLATSPYTEEEIEDILLGEVCPVCRVNALSAAGEWVSFDRDWLKEKIGDRLGKHPLFRSFFALRHRWMYNRDWSMVKPRIAEIRAMS